MSFSSDAANVVSALNSFRETSVSAGKSVINQKPLPELLSYLELETLLNDGNLEGEKLVRFLDRYLSVSTRLHHPGYFAHQVAPPHYAGALGSFVDGFTNNAAAIYEMGPGAASIEFFLINWMLGKIGWSPAPAKENPEDADREFGGGILTHGGSLANLTALVAARKRLVPDVWKTGNPGDLALLASADSHYSIARAAGILGIGMQSVYQLEVDERGAIRPDRLGGTHKRLVRDGKRPIALVANACSTAVGVYDPLEEIGDFCNRESIWFHVDGSHGASALLSRQHRTLLSGIEKADSVTWDAHKLMQTPALCAALLFRDRKTIDQAFEQEASYIIHAKDQPGVDFIHRSVECTKPSLGLKMFLVLASRGEQAIAGYIDCQFALTAEAYTYIEQQQDFTCALKPETNVLCFRMNGNDDLQTDLRDRLIRAGNFYLSTTLFKGVRYLRIVVMSDVSELADIERLIAELRVHRQQIHR